MQRARVTDSRAFAVPVLVGRLLGRLGALLGGLGSLVGSLGCASDHHVSVWGSGEAPSLGAFVTPADLDAQIAAMDTEAAALGLTRVTEIRGALPRGEGPLLVRAYEGVDALGRRAPAVRVATGRGVVMALGPLDARNPDRTQATELVVALIPGSEGKGADREGADGVLGAFRSGSDLNGDGAPDVAVRSEAGTLEIWRLTALGANRYEVEMAVAPTRAVHLDDAAQPALYGEAPLDAGDPIGARLADVGVFDGVRYSHQAPAAQAFHARRAAPRPRPADDDARLRSALEEAWHATLAGKPRAEVKSALDKTVVPPSRRAAFERAARRILMAEREP